MSTHRFYQLDVFASEPLAGNPLAVFPDSDGLDSDTMQRLAREMNLSETTFVSPSEVATRRVRFFTPAAEIPLAGHPTIGTWWCLAELGLLDLPRDGAAQVTQETGRGVLPVEIRTSAGRPVQVVMHQALPEYGATMEDVDALSSALGGAPGLVPTSPVSEVVSTALPQLMIPTVSLEALRALPSGGGGSTLVDLLRSLGTDCAMCYVSETVTPEATVHCRMFAPGLGVPEDPATGSASGALGCHLVRHGIVQPVNGKAHVVIEQGLEIGRPSRIDVTVVVDRSGTVTEVHVGGTAVTIIEGEVRL